MRVSWSLSSTNICTCWHGYDSPSLLHSQLGHPSLTKMQQVVLSLSKLSNLSCESCHLGKQSRSSFSSNVSQRASSPFNLVHSDIWGPSCVKSNLGFNILLLLLMIFQDVLGYF